jgi:AcrR family transcriptional regulator
VVLVDAVIVLLPSRRRSVRAATVDTPHLNNDPNICRFEATDTLVEAVRKTQEERKAETRARLLAAAADLFAEEGIDAVSVDAVAEAAGRTSGAVYAHFGSKQGLLLALLESWKDSVLTLLLAEVAVSDSPEDELAAVWQKVSVGAGEESERWALLEHELLLRAARDPEVAVVLRARDAEARRFSARQLAGWTARVGARPAAAPEELAVLVKALLNGLAIQRRLDPASVDDRLALRGLHALLGMEEQVSAIATPNTNTHTHTHTKRGTAP